MASVQLVIVIVIGIGVILLSMFFAGWRTKRAAYKVVDIFRRHNAVGFQNAKTIDELGLTPPSFIQKITAPRDYKTSALKILIKNEIINMTNDGKLFITDEKLNELLRLWNKI
jgi:hypothetical protein